MNFDLLIIGFGSQAKAWAMNMRDSGLNITIGLRKDSKSIKDAHARLIKEGVEVTEIKQGIKEDTLVATIKSHTNNVPTLLIEQLNK